MGMRANHIPISIIQIKKYSSLVGGYLHQPAPAPILFWTEVTAPQNAGKSAALKPRKKSILEL